jgi:drug/metabolite transporter (DMT)-like permease
MIDAKDTSLKGIVLMLGFCVFGPTIDVFAKLAAPEIPIGQIVTARMFIQFLVLLPIAAAFGLLHRPDIREMGLHLIRGFMILAATFCFFSAIRFMPIADAMAIFFVEPFLLTFMGALILKEPLGWRRILACVVGFSGALLVIKPSFAEFGWIAAFPLGTALFFGIYLLLTRTMTQRIHPVTLQVYTSAGALLLALPILMIFEGSGVAPLDPVWPKGVYVWYLLGVGISSVVAHLFLSFAFQNAPASTLAPLQYLEIVSATILGFLVFSDLPDWLTVLGILIIVGSGIYVFHREQVNRRIVAEEASKAASLVP